MALGGFSFIITKNVGVAKINIFVNPAFILEPINLTEIYKIGYLRVTGEKNYVIICLQITKKGVGLRVWKPFCDTSREEFRNEHSAD